MKIRSSFVAAAFAAILTFTLTTSAWAADAASLTVHNETGHAVVAFLFTDDHAHTSEEGGAQFAVLKNHESAVAHAPKCTFSILLVDHDDVWHAEFHDCHSTDMVFTSTTGHEHHGH